MNSPLKIPMEKKIAWDNLRNENPKLRIRDAAHQLGLSEAELVATQCEDKATRLRPEMIEIMNRVKELGYVMALTRNDQVVHERKGVYDNGSFGHKAMGLFVNKDIDLRIFWGPWKHAFAVTSEARGRILHSLQFFDEAGMAIHKIYLTPKSNLEAYQKLVADFKSEDQSWDLQTTEVPAKDAAIPDAEIDVAGFQKAWKELKDTHDFFGMLRKYKVTRTQALRLAPGPAYANMIDNEGIRRAITKAAGSGIPIMVFVGNRGMIQIHTGPVKKLMDYGTWLNVMDPAFNLHLNEAGIAETWVVRKPTVDGWVTSIEVFDQQGEMMVQVFGKRKPGIPELPEWQALVSGLENENLYV